MLFGVDSVVLLSQLLINYPKLLLLYIRRSTLPYRIIMIYADRMLKILVSKDCWKNLNEPSITASVATEPQEVELS
jgi:hypothetical protein